MIITWVEKVCKGRGGGGEQNLVEPIFVVTKLISNYFDGYGVWGFILDGHGLI